MSKIHYAIQMTPEVEELRQYLDKKTFVDEIEKLGLELDKLVNDIKNDKPITMEQFRFIEYHILNKL